MKVIDRNGRLFGVISIIDVLVVLVVALLALAVFVKNIRGTGNTGDTVITYTVKVVGARNFLADAIKEGDKVYDMDKTDTGGSLGTITHIERFEAEQLVEFSDGTIVEHVPMEDCSNMLLTIECNGTVEGHKIMLNTLYPLGVNMVRNLHTPFAQFSCTVKDISVPDTAKTPDTSNAAS